MELFKYHFLAKLAVHIQVKSVERCCFVHSSEVENGSNSKVLNVRGNDVEPKQTETSSLVFTPNVIIHICSDSPLSRNDLKVSRGYTV